MFFEVVLFSVVIVFVAIVYLLHVLDLFSQWIYGVAGTEDQRHGGQMVADVLKAHNVGFVFTLIGGHISPIIVACNKSKVRVVDVRHEVTTVFAADAVARLTGTVGVACVTAGPGVTNCVTAMKNAQMAESPVLLIGGAAATLARGRGSLQDIDHVALMRPICKFAAGVKRVRDIGPTLRRAIQEAMSGTPGPVFVELPVDILYPRRIVSKELEYHGPANSLSKKFVKWYCRNHINGVFAGAFSPAPTDPFLVQSPHVSDADVQAAAQLFSSAQRPLFVIGSQAVWPPERAETVRKAVEALGVPCYLTGMARGLLGASSDIQMRHQRREALRQADLIVLAGAACDFRLDYGRSLPRSAKVVAVNRSKALLHLNSDMFWRPTRLCHGEVSDFLIRLANALPAGPRLGSDDWLDTLRQRDTQKECSNKELANAESSGEFLNSISSLYQLDEVMDDDAVLIADGGDFVGTAAYVLRPRGPLRWLDPGPFGTLGVGGGFALGAKLVYPDSQVWIIYGDGSLGYSLAEFDTYVRMKTPVYAFVGNDACWSQIAREQRQIFKESTACDLAYSDYEVSARGLGADGVRLDKTHQAEFGRHLRDAIEKAANQPGGGRSLLVNVIIGRSAFREGSISV